MRKKKTSLRSGLMTSIVICWMVPIVIVVAMASILLGNSYRQSIQQELESGAQSALDQVSIQLETAVSTSKSVSYDGIVRSAFRSYQQSGDRIALFRNTNDYLNQSFFRNAIYKAVFVSFWDNSVAQPYVISDESSGYQIRLNYRRSEPDIMDVMSEMDTQIRFLQADGEVYMARNLLDSKFVPYATVVIMFDAQELFRPLNLLGAVRIQLDDCVIQLDEKGRLTEAVEQENSDNEIEFSTVVDDFSFSVTTTVQEYRPWEDNPWLRWAIALVALMVLPLLTVMILLFHHHVAKPMDTLAKANQLVESGQRGYQIYQLPPNAEFDKLFTHFNQMSSELKKQFEQIYLEQQASQKAQIKALQSQINPHFLNNTLEIINWEARIAENDRVSAMIEALSVMLGAALNRDGRTQIPLCEEMGYVDAYLYIIQERLGAGFLVHKDIDKRVLDMHVPRLILQPIVENAVEHDITARRGGNLWVRAYRADDRMVLEVEHDGTMTEEDRVKINRLLSDEATEGRSVGLRNVHQRLRLIYGEQGSLQLEETPAKTIRARIVFPARQE